MAQLSIMFVAGEIKQKLLRKFSEFFFCFTLFEIPSWGGEGRGSLNTKPLEIPPFTVAELIHICALIYKRVSVAILPKATEFCVNLPPRSRECAFILIECVFPCCSAWA